MSVGSEAAATRTCRICLGTEPPFVRPCACAGTMSDVHAACLERWVQEQGGVQCNVCKTDYATAGPRKLRPLREWQRPGVCDVLLWFLFLLLVLALCFAPVALILSMHFSSFLVLGDVALGIFTFLCIIVAAILTCFMGIVLRDCLGRPGAQQMGADAAHLYFVFLTVTFFLVAVNFMIASAVYYLWSPKEEEEHLRWLGWEVVTVSSLIYVILALTLLCMACTKFAHYLNRQRHTDFVDATRPHAGVENQAVDDASNA